MTKDELKVRLEALMQAAKQSEANHNAIIGRIGEVQFMIEEIEKKESANDSSHRDDAA